VALGLAGVAPATIRLPLWNPTMSERIRLTLAAAAATLLLAAVSVAGLAVHARSPVTTSNATVPRPTPVVHIATAPTWHEEHD
jgi:hypothetical protein